MLICVYDFIDVQGDNVIEEWLATLEADLRARMKLKIKVLMTADSELPPRMLTRTTDAHIQELIVNGRKALRLFLCKGPIEIRTRSEFTLLFGGEERDRRYVPSNALARAAHNRQLVINDPDNRRIRRQDEHSEEA